eukprot:5486697-Amphidinium_carterae.1
MQVLYLQAGRQQLRGQVSHLEAEVALRNLSMQGIICPDCTKMILNSVTYNDHRIESGKALFEDKK